MIHYKDMTFCNNPHCICPEELRLTDQVRADAAKWWGSDDAPICVGNRCGLPDADYVERVVASPAGWMPRQPRWSAVACIFSVGSGHASMLCKRFGFDPDETRV